MSLLKFAHTPPTTVTPNTTVLEAVQAMERDAVGAVAVVEGGQLLGMFTERDVMLRVVLKQRNPSQTKVGDVMTSPVETTTDDISEEEALTQMIERHIRHFPIVGKNGELMGVLSIRNVLEHQIDILSRQLHSMDQYLSNDGPGG